MSTPEIVKLITRCSAMTCLQAFRARTPLVAASAGMQVAVLATLLAVTGLVHAQSSPDYRLHAGDEVEVSVWKEEDLLRKAIVRPDGKFTFPLAGEVLAEGRTVEEIRSDIETRLKVYIPEPVVTVSVIGIDGNRIYIIGQVNKPGSYVMNPQINVLQALSVAAGTTPYATVNDIIVIRGKGTKQTTLPFRYNDVSKGRSLEQNILLESGDVVVVP